MHRQALDAGRRNVPEDWRHVVYSHLADITDHPAIGQTTLPAGGGGRLLLVSDGRTSASTTTARRRPSQMCCRRSPPRAVRRMLDLTVQWARSCADNATVLIADQPGP